MVLDDLGFRQELAVFCGCLGYVARDLISPFLDLDLRPCEDLCLRVTDMPQTLGEWDSPQLGLKFEEVIGGGCEHWNAQGRRHGCSTSR